MNAKIDSGTPPQREQINVKQKKESIVNRLTCATLEGVNAKVIENYCILEHNASGILENAISKFGLSHRSIASVKKIARTIADLNANEKIEKSDILEALSYRRR